MSGHNVNHPDHYNTGKIEVIDFIEDQKLNFNLGNVVKYITRLGRKDPSTQLEDLMKARWYLNREIMNWSQPEKKVLWIGILDLTPENEPIAVYADNMIDRVITDRMLVEVDLTEAWEYARADLTFEDMEIEYTTETFKREPDMIVVLGLGNPCDRMTKSVPFLNYTSIPSPIYETKSGFSDIVLAKMASYLTQKWRRKEIRISISRSPKTPGDTFCELTKVDLLMAWHSVKDTMGDKPVPELRIIDSSIVESPNLVILNIDEPDLEKYHMISFDYPVLLHYSSFEGGMYRTRYTFPLSFQGFPENVDPYVKKLITHLIETHNFKK